jgi:hypothetical protein
MRGGLRRAAGAGKTRSGLTRDLADSSGTSHGRRTLDADPSHRAALLPRSREEPSMSTKQRMPAARSDRYPGEDVGDAPFDPPVYRIDRPDLSSTRIEMPITPQARADIEENKRLLALASDRELLRHALSLQRWAVTVLRDGKRVFVTDADGRIEAEMNVEPVHKPGRQEIIFDIAPRRP